MRAHVGASILDLWDASGAPSLVVVGTGKNVGKTVTLRAIYRAALQAGICCGITSIGRDGEAVDAADARAKPRLLLAPGTILATARGVLPRSPASEILATSPLRTAAGPLIYARVRADAHYEIIGPPSAATLRAAIHELLHFAPRALIDGAVDRIAALAGGEDAVVVSCGASAAPTLRDVVDDVRALVTKLRTPACQEGIEVVAWQGAFTASHAARAIHDGEKRAIVVRDPTQIAMNGKALLHAFERLTIRCERPLRVIAATVASIGRDRECDPRELAGAVALATGLPVFDVYTAERAA